MRRIVIPTLMLLFGCATGAMVREVVAPARAQGQAGPNYEFDAVSLDSYAKGSEAKRKDVLAKYGREGWRLAAATNDRGTEFLYFERQKAQ